jgi:hypothetical protein
MIFNRTQESPFSSSFSIKLQLRTQMFPKDWGGIQNSQGIVIVNGTMEY